MAAKTKTKSGSGGSRKSPATTPSTSVIGIVDDDIATLGQQHRKPSLINVILLYITLIGLGGIGGYFAFNVLDGSRCETLLDDIERRYNKASGGASAVGGRGLATPIDHDADSSSAKLQELQTAVQTRQLWQTVERYGKGPYHVEFYLQFETSGTKGYMMMEIPALRELPHSVATFIELIEAKVYDNTLITGKNGKINIDVVNSSSTSGTPFGGNDGFGGGEAKQLDNVHRVLGFSDTAILFEENNTNRNNKYGCTTNWLGYNGLGPNLKIYGHTNNNFVCFGQIIQGTKFIENIRLAIQNNEKVTLVMAKLLTKPIKTKLNVVQHSNDEL